MKHVFVLILGILCFSFTSDTITLKREKVEQAKVVLNSVYQYLEQSNLPHKDVVEIQKGIKIAFDNLNDSVGAVMPGAKDPSDKSKK